jgi:hypothetical protein
VANKVDPLAKAIHDMCVAAGATCDHAARTADAPSVKRASKPRRRNLTLAEAEHMRAVVDELGSSWMAPRMLAEAPRKCGRR